MPNTKIKVDGKEYDLAALSNQARAQINHIRFVDSELQRQQAHIGALQTARMVYLKALQDALPDAAMKLN